MGVGSGVAVGLGVAVGRSVAVGPGVTVGLGVAVGSGAAVVPSGGSPGESGLAPVEEAVVPSGSPASPDGSAPAVGSVPSCEAAVASFPLSGSAAAVPVAGVPSGWPGGEVVSPVVVAGAAGLPGSVGSVASVASVSVSGIGRAAIVADTIAVTVASISGVSPWTASAAMSAWGGGCCGVGLGSGVMVGIPLRLGGGSVGTELPQARRMGTVIPRRAGRTSFLKLNWKCITF